MSEKPQQNVSRETAETPEKTMLNDILEKAAPNNSPAPDVSCETNPPSTEPIDSAGKTQEAEDSSAGAQKPETDKPPEKNKPSSVYVYLAVLFAAAFLMLLLAYFVQQRNNESTISGLEYDWNLSKEELMDENLRLQEENERLTTQKNLLDQRLEQVKGEKQELTDQIETSNVENSRFVNRVMIQNILDLLERFTSSGDWLMAGTLIKHYDQWFNSQNQDFYGVDTLPSQMEQYLTLREMALEQGVVQLEEITIITGSTPPLDSQKPKVETYQFPILMDFLDEGQKQDYITAENLSYVFIRYPELRQNAAYDAAEYFGTQESRDALNSENFQPDTLELFQQIWDELVSTGELIENQDGAVTTRYSPDELTPFIRMPN